MFLTRVDDNSSNVQKLCFCLTIYFRQTLNVEHDRVAAVKSVDKYQYKKYKNVKI